MSRRGAYVAEDMRIKSFSIYTDGKSLLLENKKVNR
jgi:hypothetical protein